MKLTFQELISEIDCIWNNLLEVRATFPYPREEYINEKVISSPAYYKEKGFKIKIEFEEKLTEVDIIRLKGLTSWINQNAIVRLLAVLEGSKVIGDRISIEKNLEGNEELDIARRLRHSFAHTHKYNPKDPEKLKLHRRIVKHFHLYEYDSGSLPIPMDLVIEKLFVAIKQYVKEYYELKKEI